MSLRLAAALVSCCIAAGLFSALGCRAKTGTPVAEIDSLTSYGAARKTAVKSVSIDVPANGYYRIHVAQTLALDTADTAASLYVPLLITHTPMEFPRSLALRARREDADTPSHAIVTDIIYARSKTGEYFYIAGMLRQDVDSLSLSGRLALDLRFEAYATGHDPAVEIPMGNTLQQTNVDITTDPSCRLSRRSFSVTGEQDRPLDELPAAVVPGQRKYVYSGVFAPGSTISADLALDRQRPPMWYFYWLLLTALGLAAAAMVAEYIKRGRFRTELNGLAYRLGIKQPGIGGATAYFARIQKTMMDAIAQSESVKEPGLKKLYLEDLENHLFQIRLIEELEAAENRARARRWVLPGLIAVAVLVIAFLLLTVAATAQLHARTIVKDLSIGILTDHSKEDTMQLSASFVFHVYTSKSKYRLPDSLHIVFDGNENRIDFGKIGYAPEDLKCKAPSKYFSEALCVRNAQYSAVRQDLMDIVVNPASDRYDVGSADSLLKGANPDSLWVPFLRYEAEKEEWVSPSVFAYHFHRFPFDGENVDIALSVEQFTVLKSIRVAKDESFLVTPSMDVKDWTVREEPESFVFSGTTPIQVGPGRPIVIHLQLKRYLTIRALIPIAAVLAIVINILAVVFIKNKWLGVLAGILSNAALIFLYTVFVERHTHHTFLEGRDVFSWADLIFGAGALAALITGIVRPK